jgi:hypothetical protein
MDNQLLDVLTREGVLLNVSVRYWRAAKKLQAADLGLDPNDVTDRLISLGHKKLVPKDALAGFALIESRAHSLVDANTFPFMGGIGHFLPNAKLQEVNSRLESLRQEFDRAQFTFLRDYAELRGDAAREWWEAARKLVRDPDRLVATIEDSFPRPEAMGRFFSFETHLFQLSIPEGVPQMDLVTVGDQQAVIEARNAAAQEAAASIRQGTQQFVADCVATMRQETARLCDEMLASFKGAKCGVHQKTLNRLSQFIDNFKSLNFAGDRELEAQLEEARRKFLNRPAEAYRDDERGKALLADGIRALGNTARELARADATTIVESFGAMGRRRFSLAA